MASNSEIILSARVELDKATQQVKVFANETKATMQSAGAAVQAGAGQVETAARRTATATGGMRESLRGAGAAISGLGAAAAAAGGRGGPILTLGTSLASLAVGGVGPAALAIGGLTALVSLLPRLAEKSAEAQAASDALAKALERVADAQERIKGLEREGVQVQTGRPVGEQALEERRAAIDSRIAELTGPGSAMRRLERTLQAAELEFEKAQAGPAGAASTSAAIEAAQKKIMMTEAELERARTTALQETRGLIEEFVALGRELRLVQAKRTGTGPFEQRFDIGDPKLGELVGGHIFHDGVPVPEMAIPPRVPMDPEARELSFLDFGPAQRLGTSLIPSSLAGGVRGRGAAQPSEEEIERHQRAWETAMDRAAQERAGFSAIGESAASSIARSLDQSVLSGDFDGFAAALGRTVSGALVEAVTTAFIQRPFAEVLGGFTTSIGLASGAGRNPAATAGVPAGASVPAGARP